MKELNVLNVITNKGEAAFLASVQNELGKALGCRLKLDPRRVSDPGYNIVIDDDNLAAYVVMELHLNYFLESAGHLKARDELLAMLEICWRLFVNEWRYKHQQSHEMCKRLKIIPDIEPVLRELELDISGHIDDIVSLLTWAV